LHVGHVPSGVREATRGWASLGAIVHLYPHTSPLPVSCLAQFTDKSFVTFVNNIYMEATPSPAERSRTILDILSELLAHPHHDFYRRKAHKGKRGV
jgi:hypothetical protein